MVGTDTRQRIITVTADLLQASSAASVSTREICEAAEITAPTLYYHFHDKAALYDAVAAHGFETYLSAKRALAHSEDPVDDLRHAWDAHVDFGVSHPALYTLMYGSARVGAGSPAAGEARAVLVGLLARVAAAGQLRLDEALATLVVEAACVGVTLQAIRGGFDPVVSGRLRDIVIGSVVIDEPVIGAGPNAPLPEAPGRLAVAAAELAARLDDRTAAESGLKPMELGLLGEWLRLLIATGSDPTGQ